MRSPRQLFFLVYILVFDEPCFQLALIFSKLPFKLQERVSTRCVLPYHGSIVTLQPRMFPQGYVLADGTSIPYWATINRMHCCIWRDILLTLQ